MKRLIALLLLAAGSAFALGPQTNSATVTINSRLASDFGQFQFNIGSYNDQHFSLDFDQSIAGADCYFKMSQVSSSTGIVTYLYVTNLTVSTTNVSWDVSRTNITMPLATYLAEVYADDPSNEAQSIARGKIVVSRSLFNGDEEILSPSVVTSLTSYVRKDGDFNQMSGLNGTNGQVFAYVSNGTGTWTDVVTADNAIQKDGSVVWTADQSVGTNSFTSVDEIQFVGKASLTATEGTMGYDSIHHAMAYKTDIAGVTLNPSLEEATRVYNDTGSTISDSTPVYQTGSTNVAGEDHQVPTIAVADASDPTKLEVIGVMTHSITNGGEGWAVPRGVVHNGDLTWASEGDPIFLADGGGITNVPGTYAIRIGHVNGATTNGTIGVDVGNWQADGKTERVSSALSLGRQSVFITNIAGTVYAETDLIGGGNMIYRFGGADYTLDCTTGSGTGGRARSSALTAGTDASPTLNYIYVVPDTWPVCILTNSTTHPNGQEYAWLGQVTLQSAATTLSDGPLALQRTTEAFSHGGRGRISYISERIRVIGAQWADGCAATVTDDAGGNVTLAVSSGTVYQMHRQTFPSFSDPATIYVINDPDTAYTTITNFNQITKDASGAAIANRRYIGVRIIGYVASGDDGQSRLFAQLSTGVYSIEANATADTEAYDVNTMPSNLKGGAFNIARVVLYKDNTGTWSLIQTQDKRGELLNALGTGGGASQATEFSDATFRIQDNGDVTKEIAFEASGITTATTRTLTAPDASGTIVLENVAMGNDLNVGDNDIQNVGNIYLDDISADASSISVNNDMNFTSGTDLGFSGDCDITGDNLRVGTSGLPLKEVNTLTNNVTETTYDGTTNVTQTVLTLNGTNYISWVLTGSSVTNLMALEY
jgi:hypothetical protein